MTKPLDRQLRRYEPLLRRGVKQLGIKTPLTLALRDWWYFDMPRERSRIILHCPPFHKNNIPSFLHYLCHAKILEGGWMFPVTETLNMKSDDPFYFFTINRAVDHFFDYYAWLLVNEVFGPKHFLVFTKMVADATPALIVKNLEWRTKQFGAKYPAYIMALDWFVLFPLVASRIDRQHAAKLLLLKRALAQRKNFAAATIPGISEKLAAITVFFRNLLKKYPRHGTLLADIDAFQAQYRAFYDLVWKGTEIASRIVDFY